MTAPLGTFTYLLACTTMILAPLIQEPRSQMHRIKKVLTPALRDIAAYRRPGLVEPSPRAFSPHGIHREKRSNTESLRRNSSLQKKSKVTSVSRSAAFSAHLSPHPINPAQEFPTGDSSKVKSENNTLGIETPHWCSDPPIRFPIASFSDETSREQENGARLLPL
jgi:hypothetical protein